MTKNAVAWVAEAPKGVSKLLQHIGSATSSHCRTCSVCLAALVSRHTGRPRKKADELNRARLALAAMELMREQIAAMKQQLQA